MIRLRSTSDSDVVVNASEISSMHSCRGSIGAYPCYSVIIMNCGIRYEVRDPVDQIANTIESEQSKHLTTAEDKGE